VTNDNEGGEAVGRKTTATEVKPGGWSASTGGLKDKKEK
jgi:hypothetical protein